MLPNWQTPTNPTEWAESVTMEFERLAQCHLVPFHCVVCCQHDLNAPLASPIHCIILLVLVKDTDKSKGVDLKLQTQPCQNHTRITEVSPCVKFISPVVENWCWADYKEERMVVHPCYTLVQQKTIRQHLFTNLSTRLYTVHAQTKYICHAQTSHWNTCLRYLTNTNLTPNSHSFPSPSPTATRLDIRHVNPIMVSKAPAGVAYNHQTVHLPSMTWSLIYYIWVITTAIVRPKVFIFLVCCDNCVSGIVIHD